MKNKVEDDIKKEVVFGILPVLKKEKIYNFFDAFLVLSGYCIATWSYTQGAYLATLVGFKQLLIGAFLGALLMLAIYQLPVILATRYGIDIWVWLRSVFGKNGVKIVSIIIILINFPWYAVCADLFASSMENLLGLVGVQIELEIIHKLLGIVCIILGTYIAHRGIKTLTWTTRLLVPLLIIIGVVAMSIAITSVPTNVIWNYAPNTTGFENNIIPYILSIEANFAFVITLIGGMAEIPRISKTERGGYWAGVLGQGISGSLFVVIGAVMAIAMQYLTGEMITDPAIMFITLSLPIFAFSALLLVAFANIGTQAVGSYIYGVMLKTSFNKISYKKLIWILALYGTILCLWGKIVEYFGAFLTISACIYAPIAAILFVDFFFIKRQNVSLKSLYGLDKEKKYNFKYGVNIKNLICIVVGILISLAIYNPVTGVIHNKILFYLTPTGAAFIFTGIIYYFVCRFLGAKKIITTPFNRAKTPPKQNLFFMPIIWGWSYIKTKKAGLKIHKIDMKGLKPPFLVLGTHQSFTDFLVTPLAIFPYRANYVSELEGFENYGEWLYRQAGCLGTRKFVNDLSLVKNIKKVIDRKGILVLYPEARYANVGTSTVLPDSLGKLVKLLNVPVVTINMKGNYLQSPIWNLLERKEAKLDTTIKQLLTKEKINELSVEEINAMISKELEYDEYKWQYEQKMEISYSKRAEGLHLPLYKCIECGTEYMMDSNEDRLFCSKCNAIWHMTKYGRLKRNGKEIHIPDWYEWERSAVKQEIDNGEYKLKCRVHVESLPNAINFIDLGEGLLEHDENGFKLVYKDYEQEEEKTLYFSSKSMLSIHTECDYRGKGQCVTLSTLDNTYFLFPLEKEFNNVKIQFATEYLYECKAKMGAKKC